MQDWLTTKELAELAGIRQDTIRQHILAGCIRAEKRGRFWLIPAEDAQRWLDSHKKRDMKTEAPPRTAQDIEDQEERERLNAQILEKISALESKLFKDSIDRLLAIPDEKWQAAVDADAEWQAAVDADKKKEGHEKRKTKVPRKTAQSEKDQKQRESHVAAEVHVVCPLEGCDGQIAHRYLKHLPHLVVCATCKRTFNMDLEC